MFEREFYFIPIQSGFLDFPEVCLIEKKYSNSEASTSINDKKLQKSFYVHEENIKDCVLVVK